MQFGIFYEHQLPRPWKPGDEQRLLEQALEQIELADSLGYDYAWEVEHHFLEEYSHSSAPGVFLGATAQRTEQIKLGHGIRLMPPAYNHPARVAETISTLDLLSDGRVQFGTGESSSNVELGGFAIPRDEKEAMWREATEQVTNMLTMEPYPGYDGEYVSMPARNVVPKPAQSPHPPLWLACSSRSTIKQAARLGMGALCFDFAAADNAKQWVDTYYETFENECTPIGHTVNPNIAMVTGVSVHEDRQTAIDRGAVGFAFFQYALAHYYGAGAHQPGRTNVWEAFEDAGGAEAILDGTADEPVGAIGTVDDVRTHLRGLEDAGVDQVIFIQQGGNNRHEHICASLELFAEEVLEPFHERDEAYRARKHQELEPAIRAALERKQPMESMDDDEPPIVDP